MFLGGVCGRWFFPHGKWIGQSEVDHAARPDGGSTSLSASIKAEWHTGSSYYEYRVEVTTGDKLWASTDANVFLTLTGELGHSPRMRLDMRHDAGVQHI